VYQHKRIHSSLGYLTLVEFEAHWMLALLKQVARNVYSFMGLLQRPDASGMFDSVKRVPIFQPTPSIEARCIFKKTYLAVSVSCRFKPRLISRLYVSSIIAAVLRLYEFESHLACQNVFAQTNSR
jgi:hypothetical protein